LTRISSFDVKLAQLSNNSFEWKYVDILRGSNHTLTLHTYFQGVRVYATGWNF